ncbi:MAG TPA: hypothetical protein VKT77_06825 [Chthonomonadaceae bacterium]|nr:hypothetical protein [Chthonomonadaceae bacterium]
MLSRRDFCAHGVSLGSLAALAQQPRPARRAKPASRFRLSVWVLRPVVRRVPMFRELNSDLHRWQTVRGFDSPQLSDLNDRKVLEHVRNSNPQLTIQNFEQKWTTTVQSGTWGAAPLAEGLALNVLVRADDREAALADIAKQHGKAISDEFRKAPDEIIVDLVGHIPHLGATPRERQPTGEDITGYRMISPGFLYAVNPNIAFISTLARPPRAGLPNEYSVRQVPGDIVLYSLEPIHSQ